MVFLSKGQLNRLIVNFVVISARKIVQNMGNYGSNSSSSLITKYSNDFELVIRISKELEHILTTHCQAQGKGLHEYTSSALIDGQPLPQNVVKQLRYLASLRNKLIHEKDFNSIPDRDSFVHAFQQTEQELTKLIADSNAKSGGSSTSSCIIA